VLTRPSDWKIWSRNERSITIGQRHFFASRCGRGAAFAFMRLQWNIEEMDQAEPNGAKSIGVRWRGVPTKDLSERVDITTSNYQGSMTFKCAFDDCQRRVIPGNRYCTECDAQIPF